MKKQKKERLTNDEVLFYLCLFLAVFFTFMISAYFSLE